MLTCISNHKLNLHLLGVDNARSFWYLHRVSDSSLRQACRRRVFCGVVASRRLTATQQTQSSRHLQTPKSFNETCSTPLAPKLPNPHVSMKNVIHSPVSATFA